MSAIGRHCARAASLTAVGLATVLLWPAPQTLELVSPNGEHRLSLAVTSTGATIALRGPESSEINISAMQGNPPTIALRGRSADHSSPPRLLLIDHEGSREITASAVNKKEFQQPNSP